jgi:DNA repair exonuclease SbcCD ATPase subunit
MKLLELSYKNILSYGNLLQTFTFTDEPQLILVEGENGSGKSSIKEALTVSIYGRSAIRKMKDIPNWINKNAMTSIKFLTNSGETVELTRGIEPNFSDIKINGAHFNLPDKRKVDEFIEDELTKIPFSVFCNTISLSFDDFKSFCRSMKGLIKREHYYEELEGKHLRAKNVSQLKCFDGKSLTLLRAMQLAHDIASEDEEHFMNQFRNRMRLVADMFELDDSSTYLPATPVYAEN